MMSRLSGTSLCIPRLFIFFPAPKPLLSLVSLDTSTMPASSDSQQTCPTHLIGVWTQIAHRCDSLCPILKGLGMPQPLTYIACPIADAAHTTLRISCPQNDTLEIVDKTPFGRNATKVNLDGAETPQKSKGRGKPFMLSATSSESECSLNCRLTSRGDGWWTRSERFISRDEADAPHGSILVERHVLVRPGEEDVVVKRYFRKTDEEVSTPAR